MDDLISRQAAMERLMAQNVIMEGSEYHNGFNAGVNRAQEVIRNLPTVQPDVPDINVGDMISRQAVIDLLKQMRKDGDMVPWGGKDVFARIRKLPSVQPTIVRSIGELVGYTGEPCPNCGRLRVERYENGLEICEKCNWCEQTKSYWLNGV